MILLLTTTELNNWTSDLFVSGLQIVVGLGLLILIAILIWRRYRVKSLRVPNISAAWIALDLPTYRHTLPQLKKELTRVRRYDRSLTIAILQLESDQLLKLKRSLISDSVNGKLVSHIHLMRTVQLTFSLVGSIIRDALRDSDIATYDVANNRYVIFLPESNKAQAMQTIMRLKKLLFKRTAAHLVAGLAEFPMDGLIIEDLVKKAMYSCNHKPLDQSKSKSNSQKIIAAILHNKILGSNKT